MVTCLLFAHFSLSLCILKEAGPGQRGRNSEESLWINTKNFNGPKTFSFSKYNDNITHQVSALLLWDWRMGVYIMVSWPRPRTERIILLTRAVSTSCPTCEYFSWIKNMNEYESSSHLAQRILNQGLKAFNFPCSLMFWWHWFALMLSQYGNGARMESVAWRPSSVLPGGFPGAHMDLWCGDAGQWTHVGLPHQIQARFRFSWQPLHQLHWDRRQRLSSEGNPDPWMGLRWKES